MEASKGDGRFLHETACPLFPTGGTDNVERLCVIEKDRRGRDRHEEGEEVAVVRSFSHSSWPHTTSAAKNETGA